MPSSLRRFLGATARYIKAKPQTVVGLTQHALKRRLAIPLDALRWGMDETLNRKRSVEDFQLQSRPPSLYIRTTMEVMGNRLQAAGALTVDHIDVDQERINLHLRLSDVEAEALTKGSPLAALLASGALDLNKPGSLLRFMQNLPPLVGDIQDDMVELRLMELSALKGNRVVRKLLSSLAPLVHIDAIRASDDWLLIQLRPRLHGLRQSLRAITTPA